MRLASVFKPIAVSIQHAAGRADFLPLAESAW
jgi:hypothetical protein